ncbi:unnamed protein product [Linum tenue]|uniref:KIB1-4 beta-propeller domain-containing protein n=1 Tax=Linum tenue TaxID=586396 RepID=A0AAV0QKX6_9ROSI|nr:unnamed protein product [Linum tenue]
MSKGKDAKAEEERSWSELPPELLTLISRRIIKVKDTIRFRVVCKTWWEILGEQQPLLFHQSSALLMLPYCNNEGNGSACRLFMDVERNQYHHLDFEEGLKQATCRGSAFGWLFMVQSVPVLFNPLTGDQISLPPLTTFPDILAHCPERVRGEYLVLASEFDDQIFVMGKKYVEYNFFDRIAMSAEPNAEGCVLMVICWVLDQPRLAFCKPGGDNWTLLPHPNDVPLYYKNIVFWRNKFYAIDGDNRILICDLAIPNVSYFASKGLPFLFETSYLVIGPADELMLVARSSAEREDAFGGLNEEHDAGHEEDAVGQDYRVIPAHIEQVDDDRHEVDDQNFEYCWDSDTDAEREYRPSYETRKFTVYKLNEDTNQWDEIESIGDYAMFLVTALLSRSAASTYMKILL